MNKPMFHSYNAPEGRVDDFYEPVHDAGGEWQPVNLAYYLEPDLGDLKAGWAVFNRGTPEARIERYDELELMADDSVAVQWCIDHAHTDPRCLLALCETYATDELVRGMVDNNLLLPK